MNTSIKKLGRWSKTAPQCYIKKKIRPKTDRENPPNPGSLLTLGQLTCYLGRDRNKRTTVTPGRVAQPKPSGAQRGVFFPQAGEIRPGGGSNPLPEGATGCATANRTSNLWHLLQLLQLELLS
jgi:hypothetical protein